MIPFWLSHWLSESFQFSQVWKREGLTTLLGAPQISHFRYPVVVAVSCLCRNQHPSQHYVSFCLVQFGMHIYIKANKEVDIAFMCGIKQITYIGMLQNSAPQLQVHLFSKNSNFTYVLFPRFVIRLHHQHFKVSNVVFWFRRI